MRSRSKRLVIVFFMLFSFFSASALQPKESVLVQNIVDTFNSNNPVRIAKLVSYPLLRDAPIPAIKNEAEFIARFNEVFDQHLISLITKSNIQKDWSSVGWRGIMLADGELWLDHDGRIFSVNYHSALERNIQQQALARGRRALHRSVNSFAESILEWQTPRFHVRVDKVDDGNLRYAAWSKGKHLSQQPDIILNNGRMIMEGSGRNQGYIFQNGNFSYQLKMNSGVSSQTNAGALEVYQSGKRIMQETANDVRR